MESGFIKLSRKIMDSAVYSDHDALALWVDLLFAANFKTKKFFFKGDEVEVKRGQLVTTYRDLAKRNRISLNKTYRLLEVFKKCDQIRTLVERDHTLITIVNYELYQDQDEPVKRIQNASRTLVERPIYPEEGKKKDFKDIVKAPNGASPHPSEIKPKPDVHILMDHFHELRCRVLKEKVVFTGNGHAAKEFKALLRIPIAVPEIMRRIKNYFDSQDPFIKNQSYPAALFFKHFPALKGGPMNGIQRNGYAQKELREGPRIPSVEETMAMVKRETMIESL